MIFKRVKILLACLLFATVLASCGGSSTATPGASTGTGTGQDSATPTGATAQATTAGANPGSTVDTAHPIKVTIALGYNPDIQFAPFYVALNKGYYKELGLDVTFKHGIVPDLIKLLGSGDEGVNFAVASGDEVIPARLQGIPVIYIMTWYRQYPVAAVSINGKGPTLKSPADLKGRSVGVPGPYGSNYTGLLALLKAGNLTLNDIQMKSIGFTQVENLVQGQVDTAMVYAANEPVQLRNQGYDVSTLNVSDYMQLASNGLITNENTFKNTDLVSRVVRATEKGIEDTIKDPEGAFQSSLTQVPQAGGTNKNVQMKVLQETIKLMQAKSGDPAAQHPVGWTDLQTWSNTQDFLYDSKIITKKGNIQDMFSNQFVGAANQ